MSFSASLSRLSRLNNFPIAFGLRETSLAVVGLSVFSLVAALALEYIGGFRPCHLCLVERYPYYAAVPVALLAFFLARPLPLASRALLALIAMAFVYNAWLGVYHSGIEWGWWPGPDGCSGVGSIAKTPNDLLRSLTRRGGIVRCDEAPLRVLGLSLASYGALLSAFLALLAGAASVGLDPVAKVLGMVRARLG